MTTTGPTRVNRARRRERRSIPPFGDGNDPNATSNLLDHVLDGCRFSPFANLVPTGQSTFFLDPDAGYVDVNPTFEIVIEHVEELQHRLGIQASDLELGLSVRSPHLRRYEVLERWGIDSVPPSSWSPDATQIAKFQTGRGMEFILAMRVVADRLELTDQGMERGKLDFTHNLEKV